MKSQSTCIHDFVSVNHDFIVQGDSGQYRIIEKRLHCRKCGKSSADIRREEEHEEYLRKEKLRADVTLKQIEPLVWEWATEHSHNRLLTDSDWSRNWRGLLDFLGSSNLPDATRQLLNFYNGGRSYVGSHLQQFIEQGLREEWKKATQWRIANHEECRRRTEQRRRDNETQQKHQNLLLKAEAARRALTLTQYLESWVNSQRGNWSHTDWLSLLESLKAAGFASIIPVPEVLGIQLERMKREWHETTQRRDEENRRYAQRRDEENRRYSELHSEAYHLAVRFFDLGRAGSIEGMRKQSEIRSNLLSLGNAAVPQIREAVIEKIGFCHMQEEYVALAALCRLIGEIGGLQARRSLHDVIAYCEEHRKPKTIYSSDFIVFILRNAEDALAKLYDG